jgi:undecaprenyl-diphosphatase
MKSTPSFVKRYSEKIPLRFLLILLLFCGALLSFVYLVHEVLLEQEQQADSAIFHFISSHLVSSARTSFMVKVTYFASAQFLQVAYAALVILYLVMKDLKRAMEIAVTGLGGFLINYVMKLSFQRIRPDNPLIEPLNNFSFPSGHATSGFIFYGLLAYLVWKTKLPLAVKYMIAAVLIFFSLLIGFSRIYLRMHYPSDVLGGICIGFAWLLLALYTFHLLKKRADREQSGA